MKLHEKIWAALDLDQVRITSIKLSMSEFRQILDDPDAREHYSDGRLFDIPLVFTDRDVWTA